MKRSRGFTLLLILILVAALGVAGYFTYKDFSSRIHNSIYPIVPGIRSLFLPTPAPSPYSSAPTPKTSPKISWSGLPQVMKDVWDLRITTSDGKKLNFSGPYRGWYWWISQDGWNINGDSNEITVFIPNKSNIGTNTSFESDDIKIGSLINSQFVKDGWAFNQQNSSKSISSGEFYDYVQAYTKDDWKCLIVTDGDLSGNSTDGWIRDIRVSCFDDLEYKKDYQEQQPILSDLNLRDEAISVGQIINNFMLISERGRRAGGLRVIKKENGKWTTVTLGSPPLCSDIQKFDIPKGVLDANCLSL